MPARGPAALPAAYQRYREDEALYFEHCLKVQTKRSQLVPLELNFTQRKILAEVRRAREEGHPPRIVCLKSRQVGVSTIAEALLFRLCHLYPNRGSLVIAHKDAATRSLFRITRRYYRNLPEDLRPKTRQDTLREIHFDHDSRLQVETVGDARAYTAHAVHVSELAFMEQAQETLDSVLQTVPNAPESLVIVESTANGVGNAYHRLWTRAMRGEREAVAHGVGFVPIFIPWYVHEEYRMKPWFLPEDLSADERLLMRRFNLGLGHIAWRRWAVETNLGGDEQRFQVEYPSTPEEAFLLSGRRVFSAPAIEFYSRFVPPAIPEAAVPGEASTLDWDEGGKRPVVLSCDRGPFRMFEPRKDRHRYILGVDPSEGDPGSTPSPIEVVDQMTLNQAAEWWGRASPDQLARYAYAASFLYAGSDGRPALIVGEANNHGIEFHSTLLRMGHPNVYFRTTTEDSVAGTVTQKPGWLQTERNKHAIIDTLARFVRDKPKLYGEADRFRIYSAGLVEELTGARYVKARNDQSTVKPEPGGTIDRVMALAMAVFVHRGSSEAPLEPLPEEELRILTDHVLRMRERDLERAERLAVDITGMTCDQLMARDDRRLERCRRDVRRGLGALR